MKSVARFAIAALALSASVAAAGAQTTLRIGLAEDPDVLDPTLARTYVGRIVFASICDKLFDIDEKLNVVPQLALSSDISADGKQVTIKLRPGVKFHDGEAFDAEAAKYSLDRHMTMQGSFRKPELSAVDKVEVVDPLTIRLVLKAPFSPLIAQLTDRAGMMVSPKAAKDMGDKFGQKPVCAGPYKFVERVQQDRIVVEKFADYWDKGNIHIDRITYTPIPDSTVRLANLRAGQLDMLERPLATDIKDIRANPRLKVGSALELGYQGMTINVGKGDAAKVFADKRIREALALAIDRKSINDVVFNGEFVPGNQWVNPQHPYYQQNTPVPPRDLARAKKLIADAGVKTPIAIHFMVPNNPETRQVAEVIQAMTAEAGFDMKIRVTEFATSLNEAEAGRFQAYMLAWSGRTDPDGNIYSFARTGQPLNYGAYSDAEVDAALDAARVKTTLEDRKAIYGKITPKLIAEGGVVYLYHRRIIIPYTEKLEGYRQMPDGLIRVVGLKFKS
ncbi:MAG: ABC transporter substrate-binding protein [Rhizobiales bacterium 65-9]|nr:ABC transporter substrate-binding protein [Hyphomicrobiales bacterium]OJY36108.1 MAG: ABC transporter substrate-binding protein [Rhizobiales bacterium 65-9]